MTQLSPLLKKESWDAEIQLFIKFLKALSMNTIKKFVIKLDASLRTW